MKLVLSAIALAAISLSAVPAAEAARCPSGQILRLSSGKCASKAAAIREGVYRSFRARPRAVVASPKPVRRPSVAEAEPVRGKSGAGTPQTPSSGGTFWPYGGLPRKLVN